MLNFCSILGNLFFPLRKCLCAFFLHSCDSSCQNMSWWGLCSPVSVASWWMRPFPPHTQVSFELSNVSVNYLSQNFLFNLSGFLLENSRYFSQRRQFRIFSPDLSPAIPNSHLSPQIGFLHDQVCFLPDTEWVFNLRGPTSSSFPSPGAPPQPLTFLPLNLHPILWVFLPALC